MPEMKIVRNGRDIGYLDVTDSALTTRPVPLRGIDWRQKGLVIAANLPGLPAPCVSYRWLHDALDVSQPRHMLWKAGEESSLFEGGPVRIGADIDCLFREETPDGKQIRIFSWRTRPVSPILREPCTVTLEIHEEGFCDTSLRVQACRGSIVYVEGSFCCRNDQGWSEGDFRMRFDGHERGYLRTSLHPTLRAQGPFELDIHSFPFLPMPRGGGYLRFRGEPPSASEEPALSMPWLIQRLLEAAADAGESIPLTFWTGIVFDEHLRSMGYTNAA